MVWCAVLTIALTSFGRTGLADEYGPKAAGPKVAWIAVFLDARSTDPKLAALRGYTPAETKVHVGDHIVFFNIDDEVHTATVRIADAFPPNATKRMGHRISEVWSTGDILVNA